MNRSMLVLLGCGSLVLGTLAAGWLVAMTPGADESVATSMAAAARREAAARRFVSSVETPVAATFSPPAAAAGPAACQTAARTEPTRSTAAATHPASTHPATASRPAADMPAAKPAQTEKRSKPSIPLVAAVKTRVSGAVALLLPSHKPNPPAPRVDHRYDGVLTVAEIGRIKGVLRLSSDQEPYWAPVADLLKTVGRRQTMAIQAGQPPEANLGGDLMRFYYAARPLLQSLREDQKTEVRRLARQMGFGSVASYI